MTDIIRRLHFNDEIIITGKATDGDRYERVKAFVCRVTTYETIAVWLEWGNCTERSFKFENIESLTIVNNGQEGGPVT